MTSPPVLPRPENARGRAPYTPDRLRADMAAHHLSLQKALKKYGLRRGELTLGAYPSARRALAADRARGLAYMNPYARLVWESALRRAIVARGLHAGPLHMLTILHHPWHFGWGRWELDLPAIVAHARAALDGRSYLLLVEVAPLLYFGHRYLAPHLQGFLFEDLPRRHRQRLAGHFAGGLGGAPAFLTKRVHDFAGASSYNVKPPAHMETCFTRSDGARRHRGRALWLTEHYFLWQHLHRHTYPDLTFAGGAGTRVLRSALREAGAGPACR